jgi:hypothetical protein
MTHTVLVRVDAAAKWPVEAQEDERLLSDDPGQMALRGDRRDLDAG